MRMGEDARNFIINLTPLVLRVSVEVVHEDESNRAHSMIQNQLYEAKSKDFCFELSDSLNLHTSVLSVFLKSQHYDIIYKSSVTSLVDTYAKHEEEFYKALEEETKTGSINHLPIELLNLGHSRQDPEPEELKHHEQPRSEDSFKIEKCGHVIDYTLL